uniref:Uncharacterized protein n=1 Tax=Tanacetum cinerariifolium TaxID=118510 RepID=A0A6L2MUD1_TANCI|nr:hypothetical protein [Tanacetum cinerariifolium]
MLQLCKCLATSYFLNTAPKQPGNEFATILTNSKRTLEKIKGSRFIRGVMIQLWSYFMGTMNIATTMGWNEPDGYVRWLNGRGRHISQVVLPAPKKFQAFNQNISKQVASFMRDPSRMMKVKEHYI